MSTPRFIVVWIAIFLFHLGSFVSSVAAMPAKKYVGQRISLDFQNAEITSVLRLISEVSKLNIVTSGRVGGRITIKLQDVPWDQALDVILRTSGLGKVQEGNIIRIAPTDVLVREELARLSQERAVDTQVPLTIELIHVNYADAKDLQSQVAAILSERGVVRVDTRTNVLIVKDTPDRVTAAANLVESLDTQTPQILIEARIVEASENASRAFGIQWGGAYVADPALGTGTGVGFPSSVAVFGAQPGNFAVNLPVAAGTGQGGSMAFSLRSISDSLSIDLILSAFESDGHGKILSNPRIMALDNEAASIETGIQIPVTTISAGAVGAVATIGEQFQNATLNLTVTPHVTSDEFIFMEVNLTRDSISSFRSPLGNPGIDTTRVTTQALVKDADTLVIGGVLELTDRNNHNGIPMLSRIPVLGYLFRNVERSSERKELIVFITPRIVRSKPAL
ncbi:MAG: type IV pilus secretin PilQ [Deltaproteobacteria bacterium]|nr:MAG: type IV pilus secretin PilQ [Deltaproteobacteria bacterium]